MEYELPEDQIQIFNQHFGKGCSVTERLIILKGKPQVKFGFWQKQKAKKAIKHLMKCLELIPNHWATKFYLGKLYQAMNEHSKALLYFKEAVDVEKSNPDVAREASISAMDAGEVELALQYSVEAMNRQPDDAGLICNHALNLVVFGNDSGALEWILKALEIDPNDPITRKVHSIIMGVKDRKIKRPKFDELP